MGLSFNTTRDVPMFREKGYNITYFGRIGNKDP